MTAPEFHLFLPQVMFRPEQIVERACSAEASGFQGIAFIDHLIPFPPMTDEQPISEAMVTATWVAAHTSTLVIGHTVLCDSLRHPALLAKQAVSLDHASQGRFELGLGWGSFPEELEAIGQSTKPVERVRRLEESLEVIKSLWSGEQTNFSGEFHQIHNMRQRPTPQTRIPIVIGGTGERTLAIVAKHADWWNVPIYGLAKLEALRSKVGAARVSAQHLIAFVGSGKTREEVTDSTQRNFGGGPFPPLIADPAELIEHFRVLSGTGVERFYVWFTDGAKPSTIQEFGERVIGAFNQ